MEKELLSFDKTLLEEFEHLIYLQNMIENRDPDVDGGNDHEELRAMFEAKVGNIKITADDFDIQPLPSVEQYANAASNSPRHLSNSDTPQPDDRSTRARTA